MTKEFLARGKRGLVYKAMHNGKEVCIKEKNPKSEAEGTIEKEARFLKIVNKKGIGPKLIKANKKRIMMEFIQGKRILDHFARVGKKEIINIMKKVLDQARELDKLGINKFELTNPYKHIIIKNKEPVMIDFEKCKQTENPKNITQTIQFFTSTKMNYLLKPKKLILNKKEFLELAKAYKKDFSEKNYKKIKNKFIP